MWGRGVGVRGNEVRIPLGVCLEPDPRWHWFRGFAGSLFSFRIDGALAARRHFLCLCKESNQRKHTPGGTPCASLRVRERARNYVRHIHVPYENAAHPGRRPSGFTWPARRASWGPGSGSKGKVKSSARVSICQARLVGPLRSGSPGGSNPAGAAHKDVRRFRPGQDAPSENSRRDCAPAAQRRADRRGVFLLPTFLCTSKEK